MMIKSFTDFESFIKGKFPDISDGKMEKFKEMEALYREWKSRIKVISRKDIDMLYMLHVIHSIAIA